MQKNHLRDYVRNLLPRVDKTNKYHPVVVDHAIEKALNGVFAEIAIKRPHELDQYATEIDLVLTQDEGSSNYWAALAPYVPIPDKRSGIRLVEAQGDYAELTFIPLSQKEFFMYPNTYKSSLSDRIPYYITKDKIYFYAPTAAVISSGVTVHQIVPFTAYEDTETVNIPDGMDDFVINRALEFLRAVPPVDLANDNNDVQEQ